MFRLKALLPALMVALLAGTTARATPLPPSDVTWYYNWAPGAPSVSSDTGSGSVTFTNEPENNATGSSDIVATNLRVASTLSSSSPDVLITSGAYSLTLNLRTVEDGVVHSGSFTFTGKLSNTFSSTGANVKNAFTGITTHTFQLGSYDFTVTMNAYVPPGPPSQVQTGSIGGHVEVDLHPNIAETPEPASLVLGGLALTFVGGAAWRKRRQARLLAA